jgi:predicted outer membrane repeat protein
VTYGDLGMRRNPVLVLIITAAVLAPVSAVAQSSSPVTTAPPEAAPAPETTVAVGDEAAYRAALVALSADGAGPHTIDLTADITVDDGTDPTYTGTEPLTVDGHGFTLDGADTSRLLVMDSPNDAALTLAAVRVVGGLGAGDGGAVQVLNASMATVTESTFEGNVASGSGGAIASAASVAIAGSTFSGNQATAGNGGAVGSTAGTPEVSALDSTFRDNRAPAGDGGAIGPMSTSNDDGIERSTFVGNQAQRGGAVYVVDRAGFVNDTIVDNTASASGGGVQFAPQVQGALWFVTVTGNQAPVGANIVGGGRAQLEIVFSIVAEAVGGPGCSGPVNAQRSHVDDAACGPSPSGSPVLGPLADNGGPTPTRLPLAGSPVIDAVDVDCCAPVLGDNCAITALTGDVDQRGEPRLQDGDGITRQPPNASGEPQPADCDQGAVEVAFDGVPTEPPGPTGPIAASPGFTG